MITITLVSPSTVTMMEDTTLHVLQLLVDKNNLLIKDYSMEEIHETIFQMEHNKAPGPDGSLLSSTIISRKSSKLI
jgi:hypothetical protein